MKLIRSVGAMALIGLLAGCAQDEVILTGERLDLRSGLDGAAAQGVQAEPNRAVAIRLPKQVVNSSWTHRNNSPAHFMSGQPALGDNLTRVWSAPIGAGEDAKHRITADPVVADGRIFTIDSRATVTATSAVGATLWSRNLTPTGENKDDASGGGLAISGDTLIVTTGFGRLVALDVANGAERWTQRLDAQVTSAPTIFKGLVYVVTRDSRAFAVNLKDGRVRWQLPGTPSPSVMAGGSGPAVNGSIAIFPFGSGELVATFPKGGVRLWGSSVTGQRSGKAYTSVTDITSDPVIVGNSVYAGNQSGRLVSIDLLSGERNWTAKQGAYSAVWPAGGSLFLISDRGELLRVNASTGERIWSVQMPYFAKQKAKKRKSVYAHYGPVLAGGRLIVVSSDGLVRSFDPESGALLSTVELPDGAASNPVVVNRTLYVVSKKGELHAFR